MSVTKTRSKLRYWALRDGEFVEFRVWSKQPIKVTSKLTHKVTVQNREYYYDSAGFQRWRLVPTERLNTITQVTYVGGKVLGVVRHVDLYYELNVPLQGRIEVTKEKKDSILRRFRSW